MNQLKEVRSDDLSAEEHAWLETLCRSLEQNGRAKLALFTRGRVKQMRKIEMYKTVPLDQLSTLVEKEWQQFVQSNPKLLSEDPPTQSLAKTNQESSLQEGNNLQIENLIKSDD